MSAPLQILVDGEPCSAQWPLDRGLHYGDALFETLLVRGGGVRFEAFHAQRLREGCSRLGFAVDHSGLWEQLQRVAATRGDALVKLLVTRGDAQARGYAPAGTERARVLLFVYPPPAGSELPATVRAVSLSACLGENPALAGLKHGNRLEQVLARRALAGTGAFEGLMASSSGLLVSGTMSNVFLELDGELVTPALDRCGIAGVMRAVVLREAARLGLAVRVAELPFTVVRDCAAMAFSNARIGLLSVDELDGRVLPRSAQLQRLAGRVEALEH